MQGQEHHRNQGLSLLFFFWASPSSSPSSGLSSSGLQPPSGTHPVHRGQSRGSHSKQEDELNPGTPWYLFG